MLDFPGSTRLPADTALVLHWFSGKKFGVLKIVCNWKGLFFNNVGPSLLFLWDHLIYLDCKWSGFWMAGTTATDLIFLSLFNSPVLTCSLPPWPWFSSAGHIGPWSSTWRSTRWCSSLTSRARNHFGCRWSLCRTSRWPLRTGWPRRPTSPPSRLGTTLGRLSGQGLAWLLPEMSFNKQWHHFREMQTKIYAGFSIVCLS